MQKRAEFVGFKRQLDLASAVGCTPEQMSRWAQMDVPPRRMLKGFDRSLARALETTRRTLFIDYVGVPPSEPTRIGFISDHIPEKELRETQAITMMPTDTLFWEVLARMLPSEKDKALDYAIQLILSKQDERSPAFLRFHRLLHGDETMPEDHLDFGKVSRKKKPKP